MNRSGWSRISTAVGIAGIAVFVIIYSAEFFPRHGPPVTIKWLRDHFGQAGLIVVNIVVVLAFLALLPYRRPTQARWRTHGAFVAFVIALMTEMFGWPLLIFLLSPILDVPSLSPWMRDHFGHTAGTVGTTISFGGVVLIAWGWAQIHRAEGLVDTGLYRHIRHPQYTGIFLFTLGWILHWPSVITLVIWPVLVIAYVWLARFEERMAIDQLGDIYREYMARTKRFIPGIV